MAQQRENEYERTVVCPALFQLKSIWMVSGFQLDGSIYRSVWKFNRIWRWRNFQKVYDKIYAFYLAANPASLLPTTINNVPMWMEILYLKYATNYFSVQFIWMTKAKLLQLAILIVQTKPKQKHFDQTLAGINCFGSRWKPIKKFCL